MTAKLLVLLPLCAGALTSLSVAPASAARIETGAACSLADAIASANTNVAVGGCTAGAPAATRSSSPAPRCSALPTTARTACPSSSRDLVITSPDPAAQQLRSARDFARRHARLPPVRDRAPRPLRRAVTLRRLYLQNGRVRRHDHRRRRSRGRGRRLHPPAQRIAHHRRQRDRGMRALGIDNAERAGLRRLGRRDRRHRRQPDDPRQLVRLQRRHRRRVTSAAGQPGGAAEGGAIFATGLDAVTIRDTSISTNFATGGAGVDRAGNGRGGGLTVLRPPPRSIDVSFSANAALGGCSGSTSGTGLGGGLAAVGGSLAMKRARSAPMSSRRATARRAAAATPAAAASTHRASASRSTTPRSPDNRAEAGTGARPAPSTAWRAAAAFSSSDQRHRSRRADHRRNAATGGVSGRRRRRGAARDRDIDVVSHDRLDDRRNTRSPPPRARRRAAASTRTATTSPSATPSISGNAPTPAAACSRRAAPRPWHAERRHRQQCGDLAAGRSRSRARSSPATLRARQRHRQRQLGRARGRRPLRRRRTAPPDVATPASTT